MFNGQRKAGGMDPLARENKTVRALVETKRQADQLRKRNPDLTRDRAFALALVMMGEQAAALITDATDEDLGRADVIDPWDQ